MFEERHVSSWPALCLALVLALVAQAGCDAPAADACSSTADCFRGEICQAGRCQSITLVNNAGSPDAGGEEPDSGGGTPSCGVGKTSCSDSCVDTDSDSAHCGGCGKSCAEGQVCVGGSCTTQVADCNEEPCVGFAYCDAASGECREGCDSNTQCDDDRVCDLSSHTCTCRSGLLDCDGSCVPDASPASCEARCEPCPTSGGRRALCAGGECLLGPRSTRIAAGGEHSCVLTSVGGVSCWGSNDEGQKSPTPEGIFQEITAGDDHTCALTVQGEVECWGFGSGEDFEAPSGVFTQISAGGFHTCGLRPTGDVECWGANDQGQAGMHPGDFVQVSAAYTRTCALTSAGEVQCWGDNSGGKGDPPEGVIFTQISAAPTYTCGLTSDAVVRCWGDGSVQVPSQLTGFFTQVSAGEQEVCAVRLTGVVGCWGAGESDHTGDYREVSVGEAHACALENGGLVVCWGNNDNGQAPP